MKTRDVLVISFLVLRKIDLIVGSSNVEYYPSLDNMYIGVYAARDLVHRDVYKNRKQPYFSFRGVKIVRVGGENINTL